MTIGYVHVGAPEHGVSRYGRLLAAEARTRGGLRVLERELALTGDPAIERQRIEELGTQLAGADVVHLQYNSQSTNGVWGAEWQPLRRLRLLARSVRVPLVVTLHDVCTLPPLSARALLRHPTQQVPAARRRAPQYATLQWLRRRAARLLVCSQHERVRAVARHARVIVIPHFVERRELPTSNAEAKAALGLNGKRVVTLLGYIHQRKGHALLIDALAELPSDVVAVFAGGTPQADDSFLRSLWSRAAERGVTDRLHVTGFVPDEELTPYLAATDLAVCPFRSMSASGSLSTWIAVERPILASDLPQIAEYNALEPGVIRTFNPWTASSLARAIRTALDADQANGREARSRLRSQLLLPSIVDRHVEVYRCVGQGFSPDKLGDQ